MPLDVKAFKRELNSVQTIGELDPLIESHLYDNNSDIDQIYAIVLNHRNTAQVIIANAVDEVVQYAHKQELYDLSKLEGDFIIFINKMESHITSNADSIAVILELFKLHLNEVIIEHVVSKLSDPNTGLALLISKIQILRNIYDNEMTSRSRKSLRDNNKTHYKFRTDKQLQLLLGKKIQSPSLDIVDINEHIQKSVLGLERIRNTIYAILEEREFLLPYDNYDPSCTVSSSYIELCIRAEQQLAILNNLKVDLESLCLREENPPVWYRRYIARNTSVLKEDNQHALIGVKFERLFKLFTNEFIKVISEQRLNLDEIKDLFSTFIANNLALSPQIISESMIILDAQSCRFSACIKELDDYYEQFNLSENRDALDISELRIYEDLSDKVLAIKDQLISMQQALSTQRTSFANVIGKATSKLSDLETQYNKLEQQICEQQCRIEFFTEQVTTKIKESKERQESYERISNQLENIVGTTEDESYHSPADDIEAPQNRTSQFSPTKKSPKLASPISPNAPAKRRLALFINTAKSHIGAISETPQLKIPSILRRGHSRKSNSSELREQNGATRKRKAEVLNDASNDLGLNKRIKHSP